MYGYVMRSVAVVALDLKITENVGFNSCELVCVEIIAAACLGVGMIYLQV